MDITPEKRKDKSRSSTRLQSLAEEDSSSSDESPSHIDKISEYMKEHGPITSTYQSLRLKTFLVLEGGWRPWDHIVQYSVLFLIVANTIMFILSTVTSIRQVAEIPMDYIEAACIYIFMLEFGLRIWVCVEKPRFKRSGPILGRLLFLLTFSSLVDIISIIPFWIDWGIRLSSGDSHLPGRKIAQFSSALRTLRIFRILKAEKYTKAFRVLVKVLKSKRDVLLVAVMMWVFLLLCTATALFYVQNSVDPTEFSSIPASFYGAILLLTGQGFWFDVPATPAGRWVVAISNILSVAIFAIPAGILASGFEPIGEEMIKSRQKKLKERQSMLRRLNMRAKKERRTLDEGDYSRNDTVSEETVLIGSGGHAASGGEGAHARPHRHGGRRAAPMHLTETPADSDGEEEEEYDHHSDYDDDHSYEEDLHHLRRRVSTNITVRRFAKRVGRVIEVDKKALMPYLHDRLTHMFSSPIVALLDRHNGIVSEVHHLQPGHLYVAVTQTELNAMENQTL